MLAMASGLWEEMSLGWTIKRKHDRIGLVYLSFSRRLMQTSSLLLGRSVDNAEVMCRSLGLSSFNTVDMHHGCRCYGAVITHEDGWRIVQVLFLVFSLWSSLICELFVVGFRVILDQLKAWSRQAQKLLF